MYIFICIQTLARLHTHTGIATAGEVGYVETVKAKDMSHTHKYSHTRTNTLTLTHTHTQTHNHTHTHTHAGIATKGEVGYVEAVKDKDLTGSEMAVGANPVLGPVDSDYSGYLRAISVHTYTYTHTHTRTCTHTHTHMHACLYLIRTTPGIYARTRAGVHMHKRTYLCSLLSICVIVLSIRIICVRVFLCMCVCVRVCV